MSSLAKLTAVEAKLFLREPTANIFGILFPAGILLGLGAFPILREPSPEYGGARFVELWAPTALVLGIGVIGLQYIPAVVAAYREKGVLRRMSTTPVHPAALLGANLIIALAAAVVSALVLILSAWLVLDVPLPRHPWAFAAAFVIGFGAVLAFGMLIAAVAPNSRTANGWAMFAYMVTMFVGGVFLPRVFFPEPLLRAGDYTPPGVQALFDAWSGDAAAAAAVGVDTAGAPQLVQLAIMALLAVAAGWAGAKLFRWE